MPLHLATVEYFANLDFNDKIRMSIDQWVLDEVIRLIEDEQLDIGIDADGDIIGVYSVATEMITEGEKKAGDKFNLLDTGEFRNSIKTRVIKDTNGYGIGIDADPEKEGGDNLFDLYGERIINLTNDNLGWIINQIKINVIRILRERR
tara:strand:+ start:309 stop:752 length:444 start_codon:yes stop_codon:yes gene_type:complete